MTHSKIAKFAALVVPPLFELGTIVATPGALAATSHEDRLTYLNNHMRGVWGEVDAESSDLNDYALRTGRRLLSAYPIDPRKPCNGFGANTLWIITNGSRTETTLLLPSEY